LQEIKARYCIIQQNTLTNLVNLINNSTFTLLVSNLASRVMRITIYLLTISGGITLIGRYYWSLHYRSPVCVQLTRFSCQKEINETYCVAFTEFCP